MSCFSVGQRKEDHRRYEAAGKEVTDRDGRDSFEWHRSTRFFGGFVSQLCPEGGGFLQQKL